MSHYAYGYCGMPCALCTRCRTEGSSRCPGCSCDGYYTVPCKVHRCVREKGLDHCGQCGDFPCPKLGKMGDFRDLDTGRVKERTCRAVAAEGLPAWLAEYEEKADLLTVALERYNNGRMKRYLCELFLQQDLDTLRRIIARAAVADPPVMILDEATSSIDTRTEAIVQQGMDSLMYGRTVFVIAHRLSTVRNSHAIMVLDHGRIVERGDHDDLIRQHGLYYQLYTGAFELE